MNERRINDLALFTRLQQESQDMDPMYPVLRQLQGDLTPELALWHSIVYVAYYNVASAQCVFQHVQPGDNVQGAMAKFPTGIERRGLRGGHPMTLHFESWAGVLSTYGSLTGFVQEALTEEPTESWSRLQRMLRLPYGNGRWAAYKTGEVFMKVNGLPVQPIDMGNDFSTGPRQGLGLFFDTVKGNSPAAIRELDHQGEMLQLELRHRGVNTPIEELETALCDFHAMCDGRYYVGRDIDEMQAALLTAEQHPHSVIREEFSHWNQEIWAARLEVLPTRTLGELNGWKGVDRTRLTHYARTGEVLDR